MKRVLLLTFLLISSCGSPSGGSPPLQTNITLKDAKYWERPVLVEAAILMLYPGGGIPLKDLSALAKSQWQSGKYLTALSNYFLLLSSGKGNMVKTLTGIAKCYRDMGQYAHSAYWFDKALGIRQDFWTYYEYGKLWERIGSFGHAASIYEKAVALSGKVPYRFAVLAGKKLASAYFSAGEDAASHGDYAGARTWLLKILTTPFISSGYTAEKAKYWLDRW
ncbi:MAG: hypothetical protein A2Y33_09870 [Spirochaetes bacterium GWF1_51_8]|nr:MAG: hypothetical protein A2Y33_09870 [Spirochaetes bacterium GWF1_51_8]